jgi:hypothetical protein
MSVGRGGGDSCSNRGALASTFSHGERIASRPTVTSRDHHGPFLIERRDPGWAS